jgi:hypothetical protein
MRLDHGQADRDAEWQARSLVAELGAGDHVGQAAGGFQRAGLVRPLQQDSELVAAEPRYAVALADPFRQHLRDEHQASSPA